MLPTARVAAQQALLVDRLDDPALPAGSACTDAANDCSLRGAISRAADGDTIRWDLPGTIRLTQGPIPVDKSLTLSGGGAATHLLDGGGQSGLLTLGNGQRLDLQGITLQNGRDSTGSGGALHMAHGTLTLTDVVIRGNTARVGGGLGIDVRRGTATLTLTRVNLLDNQALAAQQGGGAIYAHFAAAPHAPTTVDGAAAPADSAALPPPRIVLDIRDSRFENNSAPARGGAIYAHSPRHVPSATPALAVSIADSAFIGNQAAEGGAIYQSAWDDQAWTQLVISTTTFAANRAVNSVATNGSGGALVLSALNRDPTGLARADLTVVNSLFHANQSASGGGGALYIASQSNGGPAAAAATRVDLYNVTLSGNRTGNEGGALLGYAFSLNSSLVSHTYTLTHITAFDNQAGIGLGDHLALSNLSVAKQSFRLHNSLLGSAPGGRATTACSLYEARLDGSHNLISDTSCGPGLRVDSPRGVVPTLADNGGPTLTHSLYAGSNALDALPAGACPQLVVTSTLLVDQRGLPRPFGAACDIGALEVQTTDLPVEPAPLYLPLLAAPRGS